jgi:TRAP-type C4-dicarboxylate transport system permease small subunit
MERFVFTVERIAGLFLLAVAVLTFGSVILRYLFATQIPDWFDFSKLLQGIAIFWGIACVCYRNEHIMVDLLWEKSTLEGKRRIDLIATGILLIFLVLMTWMLGAKVWQSVQSTQATSDLRVPIGPFHVVAWLGVLAAAITTTMRLANIWRRSTQGELQQTAEI